MPARLIASTVTLFVVWGWPAAATGRDNLSQAAKAVDRFRKGERYQPPPTGFISDGKLLEEEVGPLGPVLRRESAEVREQIVNLVADAAQRSDPLYVAGGQLIRHPLVLLMLVDEGLSKPDLGREAALRALQESAPAALLRSYEETLTADLKQWPGPTAFLLIAKVKPAAARSVVHDLMHPPPPSEQPSPTASTASSPTSSATPSPTASPAPAQPAQPQQQWANSLEARVAAAALGEIEIENEYTQAFSATTNPEEKARLAKILGWIGTKTALRTLGRGLRTDLVIDKFMVIKRSVRVDVLQALSYNFPDEPALYESQIYDDSGYARAERFCEEQLDVTWDRPRPPFLKVMGYPIPMPPVR